MGNRVRRAPAAAGRCAVTYQVTETAGVPIKAWTEGVPVEPGALDQLRRVAELPFVVRHVAVMPDVHVGIGATVGSVVATRSAIVPAAVGVDIGCGMVAVRTNLMASDLPDSLGELRSAIEQAVPHGRTDNGGRNDRGAWGDQSAGTPGRKAALVWSVGDRVLGRDLDPLYPRFSEICQRHPAIEQSNHVRHLGTLGTGNHFIEVCLDTHQGVWVMLHSGSRGVGGRIGSYFIEAAKREMERFFIHLPDRDLAFLPHGTPLFDDYWRAVMWAQDYATTNRLLMMDATLGAVAETLGRPVTMLDAAVECHHNYVAQEHHFGETVYVTRKGAVRARVRDLGIIPGSMGARSYIVRGKGNPESFCSCSHGAGRVMSRAEAKRRVTLEEHAQAVAGVECRLDADVVDETPAAYKPIDQVMAAQADLVQIVYELKQVLCVKG